MYKTSFNSMSVKTKLLEIKGKFFANFVAVLFFYTNKFIKVITVFSYRSNC